MGDEYYTALVFNEATAEQILGRDINSWSDIKRPDAKILAETFADLPRSPSWMKADDYNIKVLIALRDDIRGSKYVYAGGFCFLGRKTGGSPISQGDRPNLFKYGVILTWLQNSSSVPGLLTRYSEDDEVDLERQRRRISQKASPEPDANDKLIVKTKAVINIKDLPGNKIPANSTYMGRRNNRAGLKQSFFHNPFPLNSEGQRKSVVEKYKHYFYGSLIDDPKFDSEIRKLLDYEYLVCYCAPKPCHCDIVLDYIIDTFKINRILEVVMNKKYGKFNKKIDLEAEVVGIHLDQPELSAEAIADRLEVGDVKIIQDILLDHRKRVHALGYIS